MKAESRRLKEAKRTEWRREKDLYGGKLAKGAAAEGKLESGKKDDKNDKNKDEE